MPDPRPRPLALVGLFVTLAALVLALVTVLTARAAGSVQVPAHLEAPHPPYALTSWTASPGTANIVLESTWMVEVDCRTGAAVSPPLGLLQFYSSGSAGSRPMRSREVQILPGDCMVPAGNTTRNGAVLVSSVGPKYGPF